MSIATEKYIVLHLEIGTQRGADEGSRETGSS